MQARRLRPMTAGTAVFLPITIVLKYRGGMSKSIVEDGRIEGIELSGEETARYSRHLMMPEVTTDGQRRLKAAHVLCIGAGGLGSPAGLYLAAAGVGTIG